jgi:hypothetical protein
MLLWATWVVADAVLENAEYAVGTGVVADATPLNAE